MFDAFNIRDLQNTKALLHGNRAVTVDDLLAQIEQELSVRHAPVKSVKPPKRKKCPACGHDMLPRIYSVDGLKIMRCSRKCGYSEVVA